MAAGKAAAQWQVPGGRVNGPPAWAKGPFYGFATLAELQDSLKSDTEQVQDLYAAANDPNHGEYMNKKFLNEAKQREAQLKTKRDEYDRLSSGAGAGSSTTPRTQAEELAFLIAKSGYNDDECQIILDHGYTLVPNASGDRNFYHTNSAGKRTKSSRADIDRILSSEYIPEELPHVNGSAAPSNELPKARPRSGRRSGRRR